MTPTFRLISAVGTPLDEQEQLHVPGLSAHLEQQLDAGIVGLLVAGTMGMMQLLNDTTYQALVKHAVRMVHGRAEVLVGVGDASATRTLDRIQAVTRYEIDGVVALCPYFIRFTQSELVDYFRLLADESPVPVFLYDLPKLTGVELELTTVEQLLTHPNIGGIKCSGPLAWTRQLLDRAADTSRVIVAQPDLLDVLVNYGVREHLDGVFALAPNWAKGVIRDVSSDIVPSPHQRALSELLACLRAGRTTFAVFEAIANALGVPGRFTTSPMQQLSEPEREALLAQPLVMQLLNGGSVPTAGKALAPHAT